MLATPTSVLGVTTTSTPARHFVTTTGAVPGTFYWRAGMRLLGFASNVRDVSPVAEEIL